LNISQKVCAGFQNKGDILLKTAKIEEVTVIYSKRGKNLSAPNFNLRN